MKKTSKFILVVFLLFVSVSFYGQNLKIMTYNIRLDVASDGENAWPNRKDYFTSQIQFYSPDVFGVQEATPGQVDYIASALPNYNKFRSAHNSYRPKTLQKVPRRQPRQG